MGWVIQEVTDKRRNLNRLFGTSSFGAYEIFAFLVLFNVECFIKKTTHIGGVCWPCKGQASWAFEG